MTRRGSALVMCLLMVALFSIMAASAFSVMRSQVRESIYQMRAAQAASIAEAGLADSIYQLRVSTTWRTGFEHKPFAGGSYSVTLTDEPSPWITSTGYSERIVLFGPAFKVARAQARIAVSTAGVRVDWAPDSWSWRAARQ